MLSIVFLSEHLSYELEVCIGSGNSELPFFSAGIPQEWQQTRPNSGREWAGINWIIRQGKIPAQLYRTVSVMSHDTK